VLFQAFNLLNVRSDTRSVFTRETLENKSAFLATGAVVVLLALLVHWDTLHGLFHTVDLTASQWLACAAVGATILVVGEVFKAILRARRRRAVAVR
jgi:Ca2+-transporting ATPase